MFTGIIESTGIVSMLVKSGGNLELRIKAAFAGRLRAGQSVAHDGVCLTVKKILKGEYLTEAIRETLAVTTIGSWNAGRLINLERAMPAAGRFEGHIVQGHTDQVALCHSILHKNGSHVCTFSFRPQKNAPVVKKGSIAVNGISLTVTDVKIRRGSRKGYFSVAVIPYTYQHTNLSLLRPGDKVNVEFDVIGKYVRG